MPNIRENLLEYFFRTVKIELRNKKDNKYDEKFNLLKKIIMPTKTINANCEDLLDKLYEMGKIIIEDNKIMEDIKNKKTNEEYNEVEKEIGKRIKVNDTGLTDETKKQIYKLRMSIRADGISKLINPKRSLHTVTNAPASIDQSTQRSWTPRPNSRFTVRGSPPSRRSFPEFVVTRGGKRNTKKYKNKKTKRRKREKSRRIRRYRRRSRD